MANTKIYEMPGCISCRLKFTLGKAEPFEAYFDGGIPDKGYPAVYMAKSIGQQLAIEASDMFRVGKIRAKKENKSVIRVGKSSKTETIHEAPAVVDEACESTDLNAYPEVTDLVGAIAILKGEYGVSATRLKSEASVLRVADEKGVSFPNLK